MTILFLALKFIKDAFDLKINFNEIFKIIVVSLALILSSYG
jgi:hypothetical protein